MPRTFIICLLLLSILSSYQNLKLSSSSKKSYILQESTRNLMKETQDYDGEYSSPNGNFYDFNLSFGPGGVLYTFNMLVDTGSPWIWVPSYQYSSGGWFNAYYDCQNSQTCTTVNSSNNSFNSYIGCIYGNIVEDNIILPDSTSIQQTFITVSQIDETYTTIQDTIAGGGYTSFGFIVPSPFQGVLGLAPNTMSSTGYTSLLETLQNQGMISNRWFTLYLEGNPYSSSQHSELYIDQIDPNCNGCGTEDDEETYGFTMIPVSNTSQWSFVLTQYNVGNNSNYPYYPSTEAILTSGIQYVAMPSNDYSNFYSQLTTTLGFGCISNYNYTGLFCQCTGGDFGSFPEITLYASSGANLTMPAYSYVIYYPDGYYSDAVSTISQNDTLRLQEFKRDLVKNMSRASFDKKTSTGARFYEDLTGYGSTSHNYYGGYSGPFYPYNITYPNSGDLCQLLIQPVEYYTGYDNNYYQQKWLLGVPFLQNYVTLFNESNGYIGFALANQPHLMNYEPGSSSMSAVERFYIILGSIAGFVVIIIVIGCMCRKNRDSSSGPKAAILIF